MSVTLVGLVYYTDDATKSYFRIVYPQFDDSELDDPQWLTDGLDPSRTAAMDKVLSANAPSIGQLTSTPLTPASATTSVTSDSTGT